MQWRSAYQQSQIVHMTAMHPLGPWTRKGVALSGFAHNPQAVLWKNKILLFHIGKQLDPGCLKNCTTGRVKRCSGACERSLHSLRGSDWAADGADSDIRCTPASHATSVAVADSFDGPWTRYPYILGDRPTNPAPFICENLCACHERILPLAHRGFTLVACI